MDGAIGLCIILCFLMVGDFATKHSLEIDRRADGWSIYFKDIAPAKKGGA